MLERDPHAGPVPQEAWQLDEETRRDKGRVQVFNATRPGGLDGWTMDAAQYEAVREAILTAIERCSGPDGTVRLQTVVDAVQDQLGDDPLFPNGRLTNFVRYTKTDLEARCQVERIPRSKPQRVTLWRTEEPPA